MTAYRFRVTLIPILDVLMLLALQRGKPTTMSGLMAFWMVIVLSTACQATVNSMQFNAQMTFFAKRVDPAIGGSYMTLLNTAANLGGTWPASFVMWLVGLLSKGPRCKTDTVTGVETCVSGRDPFFLLQFVFSMLGCLWIVVLRKRVRWVSELPDDAWRTHLLDSKQDDEALLSSTDVDLKVNNSALPRQR
jgi:MFS transporter, PAT family, solute carrier family 33 (acetyl-CoA transportor), member 1